MPKQENKNTQYMDDLTKIYELNNDVTQTRKHIISMILSSQIAGTAATNKHCTRMENLQLRSNKLKLIRHGALLKIYSKVKSVRNISPPPPLPSRRVQSHRRSPSKPKKRSQSFPFIQPLKIEHIDIQSDKVVIGMLPIECQPDQQVNKDINDSENNVIYPEGVTDLHPYETIACYRKATGQSTDFRLKPLLVGEDSKETLILGLEHFAQQHDCALNFTDKDKQFDQIIYNKSCCIIDLANIHLLATDCLTTATFQFIIDLNYHDDVAQSEDNIKQFVQDFSRAVSDVLSCENSYILVFTINEFADEHSKSQVTFGLTTPNPRRTEKLARNLQDAARTGFTNNSILERVKPGEYQFTWKPVQTYLRIRISDLDPQYNFDYRKTDVPHTRRRGGYTYHLPLGWYRHSINVLDKYRGSQTWLDYKSTEGEWAVAFHGTNAHVATGDTKQSRSSSNVNTDTEKANTTKEIDEKNDRPEFYVATHCEGGADLYTKPFTVTTYPDQSAQFRIVFQYRVKPDKFTTHKISTQVGHAWRVSGPSNIRPYGILIKKEGKNKTKKET